MTNVANDTTKMVMTILSEIFTSKSRASIIERLFNGKLDEYYLRQLERECGLGVVTLTKELERLLKLDFITKRVSGNRTYYKANDIHPLYSVFKSLVDRTSGPRFKLAELFRDREDVELAFIFGSYAKGDFHAESDIDLFVLGAISSMSLSELLSSIELDLGLLEINTHNYKIKTLMKVINDKKHFIMSLRGTEKIFLKGSLDGFEKFFK